MKHFFYLALFTLITHHGHANSEGGAAGALTESKAGFSTHFEVGPSTFTDNDGDGYDELTDCDDTNPSVNLGASEVCNGVDDNCNGSVDEGVLLTFYEDADGDGYGNPSVTTTACTAPPGYLSDSTDCNDANPVVNPGATEVCNGVDDNCNGSVDEFLPLYSYYVDWDSDGYGSPLWPFETCDPVPPVGYVTNSDDCYDLDYFVNPSATEVCNDWDDNCNGSVDEGVLLTFYEDADGDGYGNPSVTTTACTAPPGYLSDSTDCNDANPVVNPGATEVCLNGVDDNCNSLESEICLVQLWPHQCNSTLTHMSQKTGAQSAFGLFGVAATHYEFWISDGTNNWYTTNNIGLQLHKLSGIQYNTTYNVRIRWTNDGGTTWSPWGPICTLTTPAAPLPLSVQPSVCGTTISYPTLLTGLTTPVNFPTAVEIYGATQYQYRFAGPSDTVIMTTPIRNLNVTQTTGLQYNTTYVVQIRSFVYGSWSAWGPPCQITTPPMPTTQLQPGDCGATVTSPTQVIRANHMTGATQYEFEFNDGVNTYYELRPNRGFYFSLFSWPVYGTTYFVRVRWHNGTMWSGWGPICTLTYPAPLTQLQPGDCGATVTSLTQVLRANNIPGATQYEFKLSHGTSTWYLLRPNRGFYLSLFGLPPGSFPAGVYTVEVRWKDGGTGAWSAWGPVCNITLPAPLSDEAETVSENTFDVQAFPVPFHDVVQLTVETFSEEPVLISVMDLNGRIIETRQVQMEHNGLIALGETWAQGVYILRVQQGAEWRTLRVVKAMH